MAKKSKDKKSKPSKNPEINEGSNVMAAKSANSNLKQTPNASTENKREDRLILVALILALLTALVSFFAFILANLEITLEQNQFSQETQETSSQTSSSATTSDDNGMFSPVIRSEESSATSFESTSSENTTRATAGDAASVSSASIESAGSVAPNQGSVTSSVAGSSTRASYTFTAGKGESVSRLARKAINQYLQETNKSLSAEQRLFMEVNLTNASNPVFMEIGETRTFSVDFISDLVEQAENLTLKSISAWRRQARSVGYS